MSNSKVSFSYLGYNCNVSAKDGKFLVVDERGDHKGVYGSGETAMAAKKAAKECLALAVIKQRLSTPSYEDHIPWRGFAKNVIALVAKRGWLKGVSKELGMVLYLIAGENFSTPSCHTICERERREWEERVQTWIAGTEFKYCCDRAQLKRLVDMAFPPGYVNRHVDDDSPPSQTEIREASQWEVREAFSSFASYLTDKQRSVVIKMIGY